MNGDGPIGVPAHVDKRSVEDEGDLMPRTPTIFKAVLQDPELNRILDLQPELFTDLAAQGIHSQFAELYGSAQRPEKALVLHVVEAGSDEDPISISEDADRNGPNGRQREGQIRKSGLVA